MTISQALKEKNLLVAKLAKLKGRVLANNRWVKGEKPSYDAKEVFNEYIDTIEKLVNLKTQISTATVPVIGTILEMAEIKSMTAFLKQIPAKAGVEIDRYSRSMAEPMVYEVAVDEISKDEKIEEAEQRLTELQSELDAFNGTTHI